jgi:uncharacterized membrane protein
VKHGAIVLSVGGTLAAAVQAAGFAQAAGVVMLACNLVVIGAALVHVVRARLEGGRR